MKKIFAAVAVCGLICRAIPLSGAETAPEPTQIYTVQKGDTLWGLSERFFDDPFFWPNLWSRNPAVGNPHLIFPGQKLRIFPDRVEIAAPPLAEAPSPATAAQTAADSVPDKTFLVTGREGFLAEEELQGSGHIIGTPEGHVFVGTGDEVYTDIGTASGAQKGDRFDIFSSREVIIHPTRHLPVGSKIIPLGILELNGLTPSGSRARITVSYREISSGAVLVPWRENKRTIPLKAASRAQSAVIIDSLTGARHFGTGDIVFLDIGKDRGAEIGNMLYIVRNVNPGPEYRGPSTLPREVIGALVIVDTGRGISKALTVKAVSPITLGDQAVTVLPE